MPQSRIGRLVIVVLAVAAAGDCRSNVHPRGAVAESEEVRIGRLNN